MSALLERALAHLACPDDRAPLARGAGLACTRCGRAFPVHADDVVELLPARRAALPAAGAVERLYEAMYRGLFEAPFAWAAESEGWGELARLTRGHRAFIEAERARFAGWFPERIGVLADASGGAGTFSLALAPRAELALHLDLDVASINQARRAGAGRGMKNVLFVRADYLALPLAAGGVDALLCVDTVERGPAHDRALVGELGRVLRAGGALCVDFHNRRPGLTAVDESHAIFSYRRDEVSSLIAGAGLTVEELAPLGFLPAALAGLPGLAALDRALAPVMPIRWTVRARR